MSKQLRVVICGPSGMGKTTLAKGLTEEIEYLSYISGSIYDLLPRLPKNQYDLSKYDSKDKHARNFQIMTLRKNQYKDLSGNFVTDRSLYDVLGYDIQGNSLKLPQCDIDDLVGLTNNINAEGLNSFGITHIIYIPLGLNQFHNWHIAEDGKRVTNKYFQSMVGYCQAFAMSVIGLKPKKFSNLFRKNKRYELMVHSPFWDVQDGPDEKIIGKIPVLELTEMNHKKRLDVILKFLK